MEEIKRTRRAPIIVWSIIGSVLLVTASAIFGALMYGWTHQPAYTHSGEKYEFASYQVKVASEYYSAYPNSAHTGVISTQKQYDNFTNKDATEYNLMVTRLSEDEDVPDTYLAYTRAIASYGVLKGSTVTLKEPAFLKTVNEFTVTKGEDGADLLAQGAINNSHNVLEIIKEKSKIIDTKLVESRGYFSVYYKDNEAANEYEFYYYNNDLIYEYTEFGSYYNTATHMTEQYVSYCERYRIEFKGTFSLVKEAE